MKIKRVLCAAVAAVMSVLPLAACGGGSDNGGKNGDGDVSVDVYMPDGAPAIALSKLMNDGFDGANFNVVTATSIAGYVKNGTADIAVMPVNGAAALFNGGTKIKMLSVNTHGNLYLVGNTDENVGLDGLKGKRVGVIGQGQVPDLTLKLMLDESDISYVVSNTASGDSVSIRYGANGPALLPLLAQGDLDYVFLAEPAANNAVTAMNKHIVMDAQETWRELMDGDYPQACVVAKDSLVSSNPEYIKKFLTALEDSDGWAEAHAAQAIQAVKANMAEGVSSTLPDSLPAAVIERCNIKTVSAANSKTECDAFFQKLTHMPAGDLGVSVLNKVPSATFYLDASVWTNKA